MSGDPELLGVFQAEMAEIVPEMQADLLRIERGDGDGAALLEDLLRLAHDVKGSARVAGLEELSRLAHAFEARLIPWRRAARGEPVEIDLALQAVDLMRALAEEPEDAERLERGSRLRAMLQPEGAPQPGPASAPSVPARTPAGNLHLRVTREAVERVADDATLVLSDVLEASAGMDGIGAAFTKFGAIQLPPDVDRQLLDARTAIRNARQRLQGAFFRLTGHVRELDEHARALCLVPVKGLVVHLERVARDAARALGRQVDVQVEGADLDLDVQLVETLKAPLAHLVRNAVDHGLETTEERRSAGKPERGTLRLVLRRQLERLEIEVHDDGRGVDLDAVRRRLGPAAQGLDDAQLLAALLRGGVSTREQATLISGRGLGLSAVACVAEDLRGDLCASSVPGRGTTFRLSLPLQLSLVHGVVVRDGDLRLLVPFDGALVHCDGAGGGQRLAEALGLSAGRKATASIVLRGRAGERRLDVESVEGEVQVVRRPLGLHLGRPPLVDGAAILSTGEPVLILDARALAGGEIATGGGPRACRVLLVDDSATVRTQLVRELERAGCEVECAEDGQAALERLQDDGAFDAVVSDVQMPRLDGLALLARGRAQVTGPFVLMTAFPSAEDEEHGRRLGATDYLAKDSSLGTRIVAVLRAAIPPNRSLPETVR